MPSLSGVRLLADVYAAGEGPDLVLLDAGRDAYFCLPGAATGLTGDLAAGDLSGIAQELADELVGAGLAQRAAGNLRTALRFIGPARDLMSGPATRPSAGETLGFAMALAGLAFSFHGRPIAQVLAHAVRRRRGRAAPDAISEDLARRCRVFKALLPWSPVQGACLLQAALLLEFLAQAGLTADWVFGVRIWPFSAHCWLQAGDCVLNDSAERVGAYRPLLKV